MKSSNQNKPSRLSSHRRHAAFAYVEILLAAVLISILLVAALSLASNLGRSRLDTLDEEAAQFLALAMIEEIKPLSYADPALGGFGLGADENTGTRALFDDVDDYHLWSACPPQDKQGTPLDQHADLIRSVEVCYVAANDFTAVVASDEGIKRVTIQIKRGDRLLAEHIYIIADAYRTEDIVTTPAATP